ncbi:MAG: (2Fe-2S)-binding protein [Isosphaeraceae bacterium]
MRQRFVELRINGKATRVESEPGRTLLGLLRDDLDLTGSKYGCGEGRCGACTVLVEGEAVRSCLVKVESLTGKEITTIEGLETDGKLHPVQQAFLDVEAMQCGYCTPGMILSAVALLGKEPVPDDDRIVEAMRGNICRCGTYGRIVEAIRRASGRREVAR